MDSEDLEHQARLISKAQQGSHSAFSRLIELHYNALFSYLMTIAETRELAEDVTQETMMRAYQHIDRVDRPEGFKAWLLTIARNRLYSEYRRRAKRRFISYDKLLEKIGDHLPRPFRTTDPNARFPEREAVQEVLQVLPESLREPLILSCDAGLTSLEIAEILEISPGAVRQRIYRAEQGFRTRYHTSSGIDEADVDQHHATL